MMTSDTADKVASWFAIGALLMGIGSCVTSPNPINPFAVVFFAAVVGVIVRLDLGLFVRKM